MTILLYLLVGTIAGLAAGLFGVGGGVVVVPALVFLFGSQGFSLEVLTHVAVGTSLATIIVTSISSMRAHHQSGAVRWPIFWFMAMGISIGAGLGVQLVVQVSGQQLQTAIGCFLIIVAMQMGLGLKPSAQRALPGTTGLVTAGAGIGLISAIFGIGGGSLTVPFLSWCNVKMQEAVATSAACGLPIAVVATISNISAGWNNPLLPTWSSGFIYWPAFAGIVSTSIPCAVIGARLAHRLPAQQLKRAFAVFILLVGSYLFFTAVF